MSKTPDKIIPGISHAYLLIKPHVHEDDNVNKLIAFLRLSFVTVTVQRCYSCFESRTKLKIEEEYAEHKGKPFYDDLIASMLESVLVVVSVYVSEEDQPAWKALRDIVGSTDPSTAAPGTIREAFGRKSGPIRYNAVHCPDSLEKSIEFYERWINSG